MAASARTPIFRCFRATARTASALSNAAWMPAGGFAERDDLRGHPPRSEIGDDALGADQPAREGFAQRLHEMPVHRVGQAVGGADLVRHVHADALRIAFLDE